MYQNLPAIVYSGIADLGFSKDRSGSACNIFWSFVRSLDPQGSGCASFRVADAAKSLYIPKSTIYRYIKNGLRLKIFRRVKSINGIKTIYYSSVVNVCLAQGVKDLGAIVEVQVKDLKNSKAIATQAEVQKLQRASLYKAKKKDKRPLPTSDKLLSQSSKTRGLLDNVVRSTHRFLFVTPDFLTYGGSQSTIAKKMGRDRRTINRRLSNKLREKQGMAPLDRVQIAIVLSGQDVRRSDALLLSGFKAISRFFSKLVGAIAPKCNVYSEDLSLLGRRRTRKLLSRAIVQAASSCVECFIGETLMRID